MATTGTVTLNREYLNSGTFMLYKNYICSVFLKFVGACKNLVSDVVRNQPLFVQSRMYLYNLP